LEKEEFPSVWAWSGSISCSDFNSSSLPAVGVSYARPGGACVEPRGARVLFGVLSPRTVCGAPFEAERQSAQSKC